MPFKHHAARRHRIPKVRYRVTNWPAYEAGLRRRGDMTGQYEVACRLLGHRKVETTRAFYAGLEGDAAFRQLSDVLEGDRRGARAALGRRRR